MSMKLRAYMIDDYRAKIEQAYMRSEDVIVLQNVPCEMEFQADAGWMEHEGEKNQYLPVFHLNGRIKGIHGNFPYNVSSLTFSEADSVTKLRKDMLYYMTPHELAHLIETGKFFTKKFVLPDILTQNTYSFPVLVNLTIVPPPNPAEYERASYASGVQDNGLGSGSVDGIDRNNLPIFYIGFAGTGVNRKKDKLLDYYGIDFDEDYQVYALTAESSGYTEPTLIEYITEPVEEVEEQAEAYETRVLSAEEEAEMLRQQQAEHEQESVYNPQDDYQMNDEDILLAQADKNIEKRIEKVLQRENSRLLQRTKPVQQQATVVKEQQAGKDALDKLSTLERLAKQSQKGAVADFAQASKNTQSAMKPVEQVVVKEEPLTPAQERADAEKHIMEGPVEAKDVTEVAKQAVVSEAVQAEQESVKQESPDVPQQMKEVEMDLNPEVNEYTHPELTDDKADVDAGLDADEDDVEKLSDVNGADVSDARLQTKIDEAHTKESARQVAVDIQQDMHDDKNKAESKHREVSSRLEDVAEAASAMGTESDYEK